MCEHVFIISDIILFLRINTTKKFFKGKIESRFEEILLQVTDDKESIIETIKELYQKKDRQIRHLIHVFTKKMVNYCIKHQ